MPRAQPDFDLHALYRALDEQRLARGLSWAAVTAEVNRHDTRGLAQSTITGLQSRSIAEGDGILQMLIWLRRTPESFVPGFADADAERFRLPELSAGQMLRWDTRALFDALDAARHERHLTWTALARELNGFTPNMLTNLSRASRVGLPRAMRLVIWLGRPAVTFTRIALS